MQKKASPGIPSDGWGHSKWTSLFDGGGEIDGRLRRRKPAEVQSLVRKDLGDPEHIRGSVMGFLINTGAKLILVDSGAGVIGADLRSASFDPTSFGLAIVLSKSTLNMITPLSRRPCWRHLCETRRGAASQRRSAGREKRTSGFWLSEEIAKQRRRRRKSSFRSRANAAAPYRSARKWKPFTGSRTDRAWRCEPTRFRHTPGHTMHVSRFRIVEL